MATSKRENFSKTDNTKNMNSVNPGPYVGIIKNNLDPTRSGRVQVYVPALSSGDDEDPKNWRTMAYASPFFGKTYQYDSKNTANKYSNVNHTYGFWAVPPDLGNFVLCVFTGDQGAVQGYWFACIPSQLGHHMVPGIAGSKDVDASNIDNPVIKTAYKNEDTVVAEFNENDQTVEWSNFSKQKKPIHEEILSVLISQGLDEDYVRGIISSSSQRESPSAVFGFSTPGRPLNDFGSTAADKDKIRQGTATIADLAVKARRGGHTFVMDDGNWEDKDRLIRLRTSGGHQILMNDSERILYIGNSDGSVWVELTGPGHLNIYTERNLNVRSSQDINFHADRNININAGENLNISTGTSINSQSQRINVNASQSLTEFGGKVGIGSSGAIDINAASTGSFSTGSKLNITGSRINLNTEAGPGVKRPDALVINKFPDTERKDGKWKNLPNKFESIVTVAPSHEPWYNHLNTHLAGPIAPQSTSSTSAQAANTNASTASTSSQQTSSTGAATSTSSTASTSANTTKPDLKNPLSPLSTYIPTPSSIVAKVEIPGVPAVKVPATSNALDKNLSALNKISTPDPKNPWTGKDTAKAAAWNKLSAEDKKWIGKADPTDPFIMARSPSGGKLPNTSKSNNIDPSKLKDVEDIKKSVYAALPASDVMSIPSKSTDVITGVLAKAEEVKASAMDKVKSVEEDLKKQASSVADAAKAKLSSSGAVSDALTKAAKGAALGAVVGTVTGGKSGTIDGALLGAVGGALSNTGIGKSISEKISSIDTKNIVKSVAIGGAIAGIASSLGKSASNPVKPAHLNRSDNYASTEPMGDLKSSEVKALITQLGWDATKLDYTVVSDNNLLGKYQLSGKQLTEVGYIKKAAYERYADSSVNYVSSWTNKDGINSKSSFIAAKQIQEDAMYNLLLSNYKILINNGSIESNDSAEIIAGMLAVSYGIGVENVLEWKQKGTSEAVNGKTGEEYFNMGRYAINALSTKNV